MISATLSCKIREATYLCFNLKQKTLLLSAARGTEKMQRERERGVRVLGKRERERERGVRALGKRERERERERCARAGRERERERGVRALGKREREREREREGCAR